MGPIGINSSQHMVCFLLYAYFACSGYQASHSSQLLSTNEGSVCFGDKDGITDSQLFSRSDEQILLPHLHSLAWSFLGPHSHCPTSDLIVSCQDCFTYALTGLPALQSLAFSEIITPPQRSSSSIDLQYRFQLEIFS